jgi:hypothetical protein
VCSVYAVMYVFVSSACGVLCQFKFCLASASTWL